LVEAGGKRARVPPARLLSALASLAAIVAAAPQSGAAMAACRLGGAVARTPLAPRAAAPVTRLALGALRRFPDRSEVAAAACGSLAALLSCRHSEARYFAR